MTKLEDYFPIFLQANRTLEWCIGTSLVLLHPFLKFKIMVGHSTCKCDGLCMSINM